MDEDPIRRLPSELSAACYSGASVCLLSKGMRQAAGMIGQVAWYARKTAKSCFISAWLKFSEFNLSRVEV